MKRSSTLRIRRGPASSREAGGPRKETREQAFFSAEHHEPFFQPCAVQRVPEAKQENEPLKAAPEDDQEEKLARAAEENEGDRLRPVQRENMKESGLRQARDDEKEKGERHQATGDEKDEEKIHRKGKDEAGADDKTVGYVRT